MQPNCSQLVVRVAVAVVPNAGNAVRFIYKFVVISYEHLYINAHTTVLDNGGNITHKHVVDFGCV